MTDLFTPTNAATEQIPLRVYTEKAYLDYSMYVILDRALPNIGDGLKPVQRRIIYAMSELGLSAQSKHKKSARTIGDVLGKFHPHGDAACYEAMVLMAQSFSYRYPLIDGQGNWGSSDDPKSFAAMRYTEARLSQFSALLLEELGQGTADWLPNFDGELEEPAILPARVPHVLLNSTTGIAVGMATDIPPHNLTEVVNACIELIENPKATIDTICEHIKGPDFPTGAEIITPQPELKKIYESGRGSIRMRAIYEQDNNGDIIITALPYQASGAKILEQIGQQIQNKKLSIVSDLRDESDQENPIRFVIVPKNKKVDTHELMLHLFASTDLERSYRVNFNVIGLDGKPAVKPLIPLLQEWIEFRQQTLTRRLQYRLDKVLKRLHILDGLLIAFLNLDEVIEIIRYEDKPKEKLMSRFNLSDRQAEAILELKLRHLAKLEEMKIKSEQKDLAKEQDQLEKILNSKARLKTLLKKELKADCDKYGDTRLCPIVSREDAKSINFAEKIAQDPVTVILSEKGWVRSAKGHEINPVELNYKSGDKFKISIHTKSNEAVVFLDSTGRCYTLIAHTLPSARSQGEPLTGRFNVPSGAEFCGLLSNTNSSYYFLSTEAGYGFIAPFSELQTKNKAGKAVVNTADSNLLIPHGINDLESDWIAVVSSEGRLLLFKAKDLPVIARGKGNKLMNLDGKESIVASGVVSQKQGLIVYTNQRKTKLSHKDLDNYRGERARRGIKLPRGFQKAKSIEVL